MTLEEQFLLYRQFSLVTSLYYVKKLYSEYVEAHKKIQKLSQDFELYKPDCRDKEIREELWEEYLSEAKAEDQSLEKAHDFYLNTACTPEEAAQFYEDFVNWYDTELAKRDGPIKDLENRPIFKCVAFDETKGWNDDTKRKIGKNGLKYVAVREILKDTDPELAKWIIDSLFPITPGDGKIYAAYLFNANSLTYYCSPRGQYDLNFFENIVEFAWEPEGDREEEIRDSIEEQIRYGIREDGTYESPGEDMPVNAREFELEAVLQDFTKETDESELEKTVAEAYEEWVEYLQGNGGCWPYLFLKQK